MKVRADRQTDIMSAIIYEVTTAIIQDNKDNTDT